MHTMLDEAPPWKSFRVEFWVLVVRFAALSVSPCKGANRAEKGMEGLGQPACCCSSKPCRRGRQFTPVG